MARVPADLSAEQATQPSTQAPNPSPNATPIAHHTPTPNRNQADSAVHSGPAAAPMFDAPSAPTNAAGGSAPAAAALAAPIAPPPAASAPVSGPAIPAPVAGPAIPAPSTDAKAGRAEPAGSTSPAQAPADGKAGRAGPPDSASPARPPADTKPGQTSAPADAKPAAGNGGSSAADAKAARAPAGSDEAVRGLLLVGERAGPPARPADGGAWTCVGTVRAGVRLFALRGGASAAVTGLALCGEDGALPPADARGAWRRVPCDPPELAPDAPALCERAIVAGASAAGADAGQDRPASLAVQDRPASTATPPVGASSQSVADAAVVEVRLVAAGAAAGARFERVPGELNPGHGAKQYLAYLTRAGARAAVAAEWREGPVDCLGNNSVWYAAQIVDTTDDAVEVVYEHGTTKLREWIPRAATHRIAPRRTDATRPKHTLAAHEIGTPVVPIPARLSDSVAHIRALMPRLDAIATLLYERGYDAMVRIDQLKTAFPPPPEPGPNAPAEAKAAHKTAQSEWAAERARRLRAEVAPLQLAALLPESDRDFLFGAGLPELLLSVSAAVHAATRSPRP